MKHLNVLIGTCLLASVVSGQEIEPTWESLGDNQQVPDWFVDGKIGVWMHWGISSATDPTRPNGGSWYGRQDENHADFSQEDIRFTTKEGVLYAFVLAPPTEDIVIKTLATGGLLDGEIVDLSLMGSDEKSK